MSPTYIARGNFSPDPVALGMVSIALALSLANLSVIISCDNAVLPMWLLLGSTVCKYTVWALVIARMAWQLAKKKPLCYTPVPLLLAAFICDLDWLQSVFGHVSFVCLVGTDHMHWFKRDTDHCATQKC